VFDKKDKEAESHTGSGGNAEHLQDFLDAINSNGKQRNHAPIDEGFKSTLLCHLGNIAWRTGRTVNCDPATGHIVADKDAQAMWQREYEKGWEPRV
jgi:hypothetical protein